MQEGEVVTILGRNGAGRTTTLRAIMGLIGTRTGSVLIDGVETVRMAPHQIARIGIGYCPEERGIFSALSAEENLLLPPQFNSGAAAARGNLRHVSKPAASAPPVPAHACRAASSRCWQWRRILRTGARLLLLDEISEGLAPVIVQKLGEVIRTLKSKGFTVVLVEQNFRFAAPLADRFYVMEQRPHRQSSSNNPSLPRKWVCSASGWEFESTK